MVLARQREVARGAVIKLGGSDALFEFLDFLTAKGAGNLREWVLDEGMKELFGSGRSGEARQWLMGLGDEKLQEWLAFAAGLGFSGPGPWDESHG